MKNSKGNAVTGTGKVKKLQGPIRFEAIVPLVIVISLIVLYFTLFLDTHLRRGLEYAATQANGAEVNIGKLDTSVWDASVVLGDIEMTNPGLPARNRVQIGAINFRMLWDALLRGKVVINEASIVDVDIDTLRSRPGRVLPVKPAQEGEGFSDQALALMQGEFSGNVLGDLAAIAAGADPKEQLASIGGGLKSSALISEIQKTLDEKEVQWESRLASMPKGEDFSALQRRLAGVNLDDLKDVTKVYASLKELGSIRDEFNDKTKLVREAGKAMTDDLSSLKGSIFGLDEIVKEDIRNLQTRMRLPSMDTSTLSRALFGMDVLDKMQEARGYMDQARSYMPAKSEKEAIVVHERDKGRDYEFDRANGYPSFWLRKALITSSVAGGISGQIFDVSTNQGMVGRPMMVTIMGNIPQQDISDIKAELMIDHTTVMPVERLTIEVGKYSIEGRSLVSSPNVELGFAKALGSVKFTAELSEENVDVSLNNKFSQVVMDTKAQSSVVLEMINTSVAGLDSVNLDAQVTGTWSNLDWQLSTNLASALERGMSRYLKEKMDAARARIEGIVNDEIAEQRKRLFARQSEVESGLKTKLASSQAQIDKVRKQLDAARKKLEDRKQPLIGAQQQKLKQGADKLLDNLRLKF
ncbi:MAG: TIGR03545 family protein [Gallionella sp.]